MRGPERLPGGGGGVNGWSFAAVSLGRFLGRAARICLEVKDLGVCDKDMRLRHARNAHLLRDRSACYTRSDLDLDIAALASEAGGQRGNSIVARAGHSPPTRLVGARRRRRARRLRCGRKERDEG